MVSVSDTLHSLTVLHKSQLAFSLPVSNDNNKKPLTYVRPYLPAKVLFRFNKVTESFENKNLNHKPNLQEIHCNKINEIESQLAKVGKTQFSLTDFSHAMSWVFLNSQDTHIFADLVEELLLGWACRNWTPREMGGEIRGGFVSWD